jgi:hemerythrin superfamily protein
MSIYSYLKKDHRKVSELFEAIIDAPTESQKKDLFSQLQVELTLHAESEHATFYQALKKDTATKELIMHADKEHKEMKAYLTKLSKSSAIDDKWLVLLGELKYAVQHHVKEEEGEIFDKAKEVLDKETEAELEKQMKALKEKALSQIHE